MAKKRFIAFDIDGTFFRSHLFYEVVLAMAREEQLHPELNKYALDLYAKWKRREHSKAFEDFDLKTVTRLKAMLSDLDPKVYDEFVKKALPPLVDQVYMWPKQLKEKLAKQGYLTLAISGSRTEEVEIFAKHHKFDDWIGQTFHREKDGKRYTGKVTATYNDKENLLKQFVEKHDLSWEGSYAVGDTSSDIGMLELVEHPIAFNPNHSLLKLAKKNGWDIVLERKSIAYSLKPNENGEYVLSDTE